MEFYSIVTYPYKGASMKQIDTAILDELIEKARNAPRKRMNYNLHPGPDDPVQRLLNAIEPETYIRPHRHTDPETSEVYLMLRGSAVLLFFDDAGRVLEQRVLSSKGPVFAAEIPAKAWHAVASLERGTVFFECKQGPYKPLAAENQASWAPAEGDTGTPDFVAWYKKAQTNDTCPKVRRA
jgi:cupin fold WbuC family metalloprotein